MGCCVSHSVTINRTHHQSDVSEITSRSRLLLDQRTPAEKEILIQRANRRLCLIILTTMILLIITSGIVVYFAKDILISNHKPWSIDNIVLPDGFKIEEYVKGNDTNSMLKPRSLHVSIYNTATIVYVGSATPFVYALIDSNSDGINDAIFHIWQSTESSAVYSITVNEQQQTLYINDMSGNIYKCPHVHAQVLNMKSKEQRLCNCSIWVQVPFGGYLHNTHYMAINPIDNNLCIAFGAMSNIGLIEAGSVEGTIRCFNGYDIDSINDTTVYAYGVRNSVGFEFHPIVPQQMWFTDRGADGSSDDTPDDELKNVRHIGENFGFPYCHTQGYGPVDQRSTGLSDNIPDAIFGALIEDSCSIHEYIPAEQPLGPHGASSGMKFIFTDVARPTTSNRFILIAQHGSNDREPLFGYRVMMVELSGDDLDEIVEYKVFAQGWIDEDKQQFYGRPIDIGWLKHDDSFVVSDDYADVIYRIYYESDDDCGTES